MELEIIKNLPTLEEPIKIKFEVYDTALESKYLDSRDWTYYGYKTLQELEENVDKDLSLRIFQELYHSTRILSGGRLDVLLRTPVRTLNHLAKIPSVYESGDHTLLSELSSVLKELDEDDWMYLEGFESVEDALNFLDEHYNPGASFGF